MQRVDKTIYRDIPEQILDNGDTFQKPNYIAQISNKLKCMYLNEELLFVFQFENNSSIEYHQKLKYPELNRRIVSDLVSPINTYFFENTLFMLHPDRKISVIQFLKQGSNKDYIYNNPFNLFPSPDFLQTNYLIGWNEYITIFSNYKMMVIDRFNNSKLFKIFPLSFDFISNSNNDYSFGFNNQVIIVNNEPKHIIFQQYDVTNGILIKQANIPYNFKDTLYNSFAHNDKYIAVAYTNTVLIYSLNNEIKIGSPIIEPINIIKYNDGIISKIYIDSYFLIIGDYFGGASIYSCTGTFITKILPEEEFKTDKKIQTKKRVTAIYRFNLFVIIGLADGKAKFTTWDIRYNILEKKECGGKIIKIFLHPELPKIVIITENGNDERIIGLSFWSPIEKSINFISSQLAYSQELKNVSYIKPFIDQLQNFISYEFTNQSVGFKRTISKLRGIYNLIKFLEESDQSNKMPFPFNLIFQLIISIQQYCELQESILLNKEKENFFTLIRAENKILISISKICLIDTSTIQLKELNKFPKETYLNKLTNNFKSLIYSQMYKPNISKYDENDYKNYFWNLLSTLFNEYNTFSDSLESIDNLMNSITRDDLYSFVGIIKIYGRYIQIMQDIKETAWIISQIIGIKETDCWYYGGGLYMGKKLPDIISEKPIIPEKEFPLELK